MTLATKSTSTQAIGALPNGQKKSNPSYPTITCGLTYTNMTANALSKLLKSKDLHFACPFYYSYSKKKRTFAFLILNN